MILVIVGVHYCQSSTAVCYIIVDTNLKTLHSIESCFVSYK